MSKSERSHPYYHYGTDKQYQEFCRSQPSALSGRMDLDSKGRMRCVYAHYRTAANSGTGMKPPFSGIPLTFAEHNEQHRVGQYNFMPREWWESQVQEHLERWAHG